MLICKVKNISDYIYRYKTLIENFGYLTLLQICNLLIPLVTYPYLINTLGKNLYGVIIYSQAIVSYLAIFVNWGFNISATKYISINREDSKKINEIVSVVYIVKTLLLIIVFGFLFLIFLFPEIREYKLLYIFQCGNVFMNVYFLYGFSRYRKNEIYCNFFFHRTCSVYSIDIYMGHYTARLFIGSTYKWHWSYYYISYSHIYTNI